MINISATLTPACGTSPRAANTAAMLLEMATMRWRRRAGPGSSRPKIDGLKSEIKDTISATLPVATKEKP